MQNAKPVATPMESGFNNIRWADLDASYEVAKDVPYRQEIGCPMFLTLRLLSAAWHSSPNNLCSLTGLRSSAFYDMSQALATKASRLDSVKT